MGWIFVAYKTVLYMLYIITEEFFNQAFKCSNLPVHNGYHYTHTALRSWGVCFLNHQTFRRLWKQLINFTSETLYNLFVSFLSVLWECLIMFFDYICPSPNSSQIHSLPYLPRFVSISLFCPFKAIECLCFFHQKNNHVNAHENEPNIVHIVFSLSKSALFIYSEYPYSKPFMVLMTYICY